ncbi:exopolygalacturonase-like [Triticum dicoccoides]|uniref:exopolygalacturonase-like n=1 Tax=Triticum dicoccoides TaxID=85692 RepID=UPI001891460E|nr:exopolygalacturonase-like [Triticum dicoccoides]
MAASPNMAFSLFADQATRSWVQTVGADSHGLVVLARSNCIEIMRVKKLSITGKGNIDGQGKPVWTKNSCQKNYNCKILPNSLVLDFCDDALIEGISIINSKFFHMNIFQCKGVTVKDVKVNAPGDSPNSDGIHMGVGDDCISIGPGSTQVNISGVTCGCRIGPGHGISIGSLGRYKDEKDVTDITVKNCVLKGSTNGLRIRSYEDAKSPLIASKIHYENIEMDDSGYPIIIDQKYCPNKLCTSKCDADRVTVKDVTFKNITGTSATPEAVSLLCSDKKPCEGVTMSDVKIEYSGKNNKTMVVCTHVKVTATPSCPRRRPSYTKLASVRLLRPHRGAQIQLPGDLPCLPTFPRRRRRSSPGKARWRRRLRGCFCGAVAAGVEGARLRELQRTAGSRLGVPGVRGARGSCAAAVLRNLLLSPRRRLVVAVLQGALKV